MSDHKLIKVTRFTKSLKEAPRFVKKRSFKHFNDEHFKEKLTILMTGELIDHL